MSVVRDLALEAETAAKHFDSAVLEYQAIQIGDELTWPNYVSGIDRFDSYVAYFDRLVKARQYSMRLTDGTILQLYYKTQGSKITKARCAIAPQYRTRSNNDDSEAEDLAPLDETRLSHLRFDFDSGTTAHASAHIQIGALNQVRIPMDFVLRPYAFVDLSIRHFRPDEYQQISQKRHHGVAMNNSARLQPASAIPDTNCLYSSYKKG